MKNKHGLNFQFKKILSFILITVIFTVLAQNIVHNWSVIKSFPWRFSGPDFILLLLFLLPFYLINGNSWFLILRALGNKIDYFASIRIWLLSNASRFIPGVVWQYGGRIYLSSKVGIPASKTLIALLTESIFVMTVGLIIVLATFNFEHYAGGIKIFKTTILILPLLIAAISLFNNQKMMTKIIAIFQQITGKEGEIKSFKLSTYWILILLLNYLLQFIFAGSVLFFLAKQAINLDWNLYAIFIGIYAASWLLGYITIIAPAGLGVQEISIATMLSFYFTETSSAYIPFPIASMIAILFRVLLLIIEAITILFISTNFKRQNYLLTKLK